MSWQVALSAASLGLQGVSMLGQAGAARAAGGGQADALVGQGNALRFQARNEFEMAEDVRLQATQEEAKRLQQYAEIISANAADLPTRGITDSASTEAIGRANREAVGTDLLSIRYMGDAKANAHIRQAQQYEEAAQVLYRGGYVAQQAGQSAAYGALAQGGWNIASSFPNFGKAIGNWLGGGGTISYSGSAAP